MDVSFYLVLIYDLQVWKRKKPRTSVRSGFRSIGWCGIRVVGGGGRNGERTRLACCSRRLAAILVSRIGAAANIKVTLRVWEYDSAASRRRVHASRVRSPEGKQPRASPNDFSCLTSLRVCRGRVSCDAESKQKDALCQHSFQRLAD
jgi:hypothetical protein